MMISSQRKHKYRNAVVRGSRLAIVGELASLRTQDSRRRPLRFHLGATGMDNPHCLMCWTRSVLSRPQTRLVKAIQQAAKDQVVLNVAISCGYIVNAAIRPTSYEH